MLAHPELVYTQLIRSDGQLHVLAVTLRQAFGRMLERHDGDAVLTGFNRASDFPRSAGFRSGDDVRRDSDDDARLSRVAAAVSVSA